MDAIWYILILLITFLIAILILIAHGLILPHISIIVS